MSLKCEISVLPTKSFCKPNVYETNYVVDPSFYVRLVSTQIVLILINNAK